MRTLPFRPRTKKTQCRYGHPTGPQDRFANGACKRCQRIRNRQRLHSSYGVCKYNHPGAIDTLLRREICAYCQRSYRRAWRRQRGRGLLIFEFLAPEAPLLPLVISDISYD